MAEDVEDVVRVCGMFEVIYQEGQPANHIFIVEEGSFTTQSSDRNSRLQIEPYEPGSVLGMFDAMLERPYTKTVECVSGGRLRMISRDEMNTELDSADTFLKAVLKSTVKRLEAKHKKGFT